MGKLLVVILWLLLAWGILAAGFGLVALGTGADLETLSMRRDLNDLVAASAHADAQAMMRYLQFQAVLTSRVALALLATGPMLVVVCIVALRRSRARS